MEEGGYGWGYAGVSCQDCSQGGKKSVEPKPEENLLSQCQEAIPHPACSDLLLPLLGGSAQSTHHPCLLWRGITVRFRVVL